jgi:hypothetical protein
MLQMRRQVDDERSRRGLLRDDDALMVLQRSAQILSANSIAALHFADGLLEIELTAAAAPQAEASAGEIKSQGLLVEVQKEGSATRMRIRSGSLR